MVYNILRITLTGVNMKPIHLGLIPDGNRRWAQEHGLDAWEGHIRGARVMEECLKWCVEAGIEEVSVYALSSENLAKRPNEELGKIYSIFAEYFKKLSRDEFVHKYEVRVRVLGHTYRLPKFVLSAAHDVAKATHKNTKHFLNILVAYGGQDELLRCIRGASESRFGKITRKLLEKYLWVSRPVDLVIRTGSDHRLSNFLLYQSAYAEIAFVDKYWPDFTREDFDKCLEQYDRSQRRMGA
jgi:tritrans,polycis-undecaprenyl-diphosphate synthase [geranylgeranyl-diphosphate specific]